MAINRREFCAAVGAVGVGAWAGGSALGREGGSPPLRVIAYNIFACRGWPDDRPLARRAVEAGQMAQRLAMELALHDADIISFSESPSEEMTQQVADQLGMNHLRFPSGGNWPGTLLSRFDIANSQNVPLGRSRPEDLFTRHWGRATVTLPNGEPLIVHSAHLHPAPDPTVRLREVRAMLAAMEDDLAAERSMLLIGDLNHTPDAEEHRLWRDAGWVDTFTAVGQGEGLTIKADIPSRRIDYVLVTGPLARHVAESRPLFEGAFRVNVDDPQSFALSDHLPQLAVFGGAE